ncbi:hypothetical protein [Janthinobacterium agaricidamnosum]|uniref:Uncharacterized protein n=1 Tax=Janthinobacterium agaricidamnosum NBRC 102515 = DSM 9628 TaxID=1349767 RepID=W0V201_9BURK|nr:hypothetical protein [Janthinobacterium agaricidamnosum]CDG82854.1 hypothetical protein GJA_2219 [Janthinobacterium agaricidamnosum NBRC 102515 = DSM 9628]
MHPLEGDTRYGKAMQALRAFYFPDAQRAIHGWQGKTACWLEISLKSRRLSFSCND